LIHLGTAGMVASVVSLRGPVHMPSIAYRALLPELILIGGGFVHLVISAITGRRMPRWAHTMVALLVALASLGASAYLWYYLRGLGHGFVTVDGAIIADGFSALFCVLISSALVVTVLLTHAFGEREDTSGPELPALATLSASGAMLMAASGDLIMVFLGLEILSIALYVLAGLDHRRDASGEAALKYFILGAFSSALFLYGIALTYGATGTTGIVGIAAFLSHNVLISNAVLLGGLALMLVGLGFKVAAVPFHLWTPDVYQGSPTPVTGFMSSVAKAGGFAALIRVLMLSFHTYRLDWEPVIWVLAVLSLVVGSVLAIAQSDVKRMLAYSSISHAGFVLVGLQAASAAGVAGSLYYLMAYSFMTLGSFAIVYVLGRRGDADHQIASYRGLARRQPVLALGFALLLLAQSGAPFTTGFFAKFSVIAAAAASHSYALAIIAMVSAVIAAFFYLRVVVVMYSPTRTGEATAAVAGPVAAALVDDPVGVELPAPLPAAASGEALQVAPVGGVTVVDEAEAEGGSVEGEAEREPVPLSAQLAIGICVTFTIVFGVDAAPLVNFAHHAALLLAK
jgi:NADH-quinone oxidoreductase subunit N